MNNEDALPEQDSPQPAPADASDWVPEEEPAAPAPGDDVAADLETLVTLVAERDKYLDQLQRTTADFDNYRKRVQRELSEARDAGASSLAGKLFDVLDTVDLALAHDPSDAVAQVAGALFDALGKEGLARIDALGQAFDPEVHDAVVHEEGDGPAEVIEVLRSGWKWNGRVVRPAMVKTKGS
jgi:molecular chaperone GrpE